MYSPMYVQPGAGERHTVTGHVSGATQLPPTQLINVHKPLRIPSQTCRMHDVRGGLEFNVLRREQVSDGEIDSR